MKTIACQSVKEASDLIAVMGKGEVKSCPRCGGNGIIPVFAAWGATCRVCNGKGWALEV